MERFTKEELEKWWHAQCPKCGWDGLSRDCAGGEPIADTGDFGDPLCPMCIKKDDYVVVDDYAEPDAQATIAALQARVQELEQWVQDQSTANLETMRHTDEMQSRALEAEQQLTQRTAELEAARVDNRTYINERHENMKQIESLQAELERVKALLLALPKVEGEINERFCTGSYYSSPHDYRSHVTFETALVALLKHRQGME